MNPLSPNAQRNRVRKDVRAVLNDWPEGALTWGPDYLSAVVTIIEPGSTYIVRVTPEGAWSLWVSHKTGVASQWQEGWVD